MHDLLMLLWSAEIPGDLRLFLINNQTCLMRSFTKIKSTFCFIVFSFCSIHAQGQTVSKYIVVDQFGYLPASRKIAVIRDPQTGFDAAESFIPGTQYALVNKASG